MTDLELLYKDCYQRMLTVARLMLKNDDEASDTVSDVFARLAEGLHSASVSRNTSQR